MALAVFFPLLHYKNIKKHLHDITKIKETAKNICKAIIKQDTPRDLKDSIVLQISEH